MLPVTESEIDEIELFKAVEDLLETVDNLTRRCENHIAFCAKLDDELLQVERYLRNDNNAIGLNN